MRVFTCDDRFGAMNTCIYVAWEWGIRNGHENLRIQKEPVEQYTLFDEYVHVDEDPEKTAKVVRSIEKKISYNAYISVYYAATYYEDMMNEIYQFLRIGFRVGRPVTNMLAEPAVMSMMEARRAVWNEAHFWREFMRFDRAGNVLISHFEPKSQVIEFVGHHFADRMPSENWMIIDDRRRIALVHPCEGESYIRILSEEEWMRLRESEKASDEYKQMWKDFVETIAIKERVNPRCQRNMFPLWMRKHASEFMN